MERLDDHGELQELLGAYALDAVEPDEAARIEAHLPTCPRCAAELAGHREVTDLFAYAGQEAPEGLWDRIVAGMAETPPELRIDRLRPSMRTAADVAGTATGAGPAVGLRTPVGPARRAANDRWSRTRVVVALAAAAAIAVVAVLGVQVTRLQHRVNTISAAGIPATATMGDVRRALAEPGSRRIVLNSPGPSDASLDAVITVGGQGFLYDSRLTPLSADRVYQLWGVVGHAEISYGLLGTDPTVVAFTAGPGVQALAVTDEVASGVAQTHQPFVAIGTVTPAL